MGSLALPAASCRTSGRLCCCCQLRCFAATASGVMADAVGALAPAAPACCCSLLGSDSGAGTSAPPSDAARSSASVAGNLYARAAGLSTPASSATHASPSPGGACQLQVSWDFQPLSDQSMLQYDEQNGCTIKFLTDLLE